MKVDRRQDEGTLNHSPFLPCWPHYLGASWNIPIKGSETYLQLNASSCLLQRIRSHAELGLHAAPFAAQLRDLMYQGVKMSVLDFNESVSLSVYC